MFGKPLSLLSVADIDRLWKEQVRESDVVEFKEALSAKGGPDAWHGGAEKIGDTARDKIIHEIIAFANAHGGNLVLGIAESSDKPARAQSVKPIGRCSDLAERLSRALADLVEPPLAPFPVIVPVHTAGDAGVIVFQVTASLNAPHRNRSTLQSYIRRGEQAVPMTMREIQDLTMQVERGLTLLERQYTESAERFSSARHRSIGLALRATAVPLSPLSVPVPTDTTINPTFERFGGSKGGRAFEVGVPRAPLNFRPTLRGIRALENNSQGSVSADIKANGLLEIFFFMVDGEGLVFPANWYVGIACNALSIADTLRTVAGSPGTEYGLELEAYAPGSPSVHEIGGREYSSDSRWPGGGITFPRYHVGDRSSFVEVMKLVDVDFWNALGKRGDASLLMKF